MPAVGVPSGGFENWRLCISIKIALYKLKFHFHIEVLVVNLKLNILTRVKTLTLANSYYLGAERRSTLELRHNQSVPRWRGAFLQLPYRMRHPQKK